MATLWLFGAIYMFAPTYVGFGGLWKWVLIVLGFVLVAMSLAGALTELSKLLKSEALNYFGVGLLFVVPAIGLFAVTHLLSPSKPWIILTKVGTLLFFALGGALIFQGVPYLLWRDANNYDSALPPENHRLGRRGATREAGASLIVAMLSLATAIIGLVNELTK